jgi:DNA-binding transcriptional LysR family regulator
MINEFKGDFFQWLRGFYYVAKIGSVSGAAVEMGRRQPTITHQIRCLEDCFDVKLFEYSRQTMHLTPEGELLLDYTITIFDTIKELSDSLAKAQKDLSGKISITCTHALTMYYLARFVSDFKRKSPNVDFDINSGLLDTIQKEVYFGNCDFGIVYLDAVEGNFATYSLFETSLSLISSKDNPYKLSKNPTLKEISGIPFIYYPPPSTIKALVDRKFSEDGLEIKKAMVLNHFESVKEFVRQGTGISILFDYAITDHDRSKMIVISLEKYFGKTKTGIIMRKKKYLSPIVKSFIKMLNPDLQLM